MDTARALCASALGLILFVLFAGFIAGASTADGFAIVGICYLASFLVAVFALIAGVKGCVRKDALQACAAAIALLVAIACFAFVAYFGDCTRDLFRVSNERMGGEADVAGETTEGPSGK